MDLIRIRSLFLPFHYPIHDFRIYLGGQRAELMEFASATVDVTIDDRLAVTRMDQVFTNRSSEVVEGIYEFTLRVLLRMRRR